MFRSAPQKGKVNLRGLASEHYFKVRKIGKWLPFHFLSVRLILLYKRFISKGTCLYQPTCSQYMLISIHNNGFLVGVILGLWRIVRCNPFSKGGYDPPKENFVLYQWLQ